MSAPWLAFLGGILTLAIAWADYEIREWRHHARLRARDGGAR